MKITFSVHSIAEQPFQVKARLGGKEIDAQVAGLVVELVSEDGSMSQVIRVSDDIEGARKVFVAGGSVVATYKKDAG